jgi:glycosyltransferase involved in cell wall biosynthesis
VILLTDLGIVMPIYYQKEEHIRNAIRTILTQSHTDFSFYIVVDGALDLLPIIYDEIDEDKRVKIIAYKENKGVAFALNRGFEEIYRDPNIKYTTWVSSDNIYYPFFLKTLYEGIVNSSKDIGIVYTSFNRIFDNGEPAHDEKYLSTLHEWQSSTDTMFEGCIIGPAFIHRVEYCKLVEPYRITLIQDYDYWLRMMDICKIKYIPVETMEYRIDSPLSLSTNINTSPKYHRICWNEVHLAHWETRKRRGILPELTIVYFLYEATEQTLKNFGNVIDQFWTNYKLYLVNCSPRNNLKEINEIYFDPRVTFLDGVKNNPNNELIKLISNLDTPYYMFCDGSLPFLNRSILKKLMNTLKENPDCTSATYHNDNNIVTSTVSSSKFQPYAIYKSKDVKYHYGVK